VTATAPLLYTDDGRVIVVSIGGQVIYALQPKQFEFYCLTPLYREFGPTNLGYGGAAGGAKSHTARAIAVAVALFWPGSTSIIFRRTEKEVKENHLYKFLEEVPREVELNGKRQRLYSYNGSDLAFTFLNGSRIILGHLRHEEDVFKYQGPAFDLMIFEESTHFSAKQVEWLTGNRLRATVPGSRPFAVYPSNPGNRGHSWYKRKFITRNYRDGEDPADYAFIQSFLKDNQILMQRDPTYLVKLNRLPEPWRSWMRDGNWSAGAGAALPELNRQVHIVDPFDIPRHWPRFGAFDWGYSHPFSFGEYACTEDGDVFKVETVIGHRLQPHEIADRIKRKVDVSRLQYMVAGHDLWAEIKARGENTPTLAEQFQQHGLHFSQANIDRVQGLNNLRGYTAWQSTGPDGTEGDPALRFLDTEGNNRCFEQLENMVTDPDEQEDALKVDADDFGDGGDDCYDETRYGLASRVSKAPSMVRREKVQAFSKATLTYEHDRLYRGRGDSREVPTRRDQLNHPEFGGQF
jgi:phage terminase large subunit